MMTNYSLNDKITNTCNKALAFIASQQNTAGSFSKQTVFYTGLIINTLEKNTDTVAASIKEKGVAFLLGQKNKDWSYNYWQSDTISYRAKPYPNDLDDTFVALQAISAVVPDVLTEKAWGNIMRLLINNESVPGGPYQTWIMPPHKRTPAWQDIDLVVNSNIAAFLLRFDIKLPAMQDYLDEMISQQSFASKYYHDDITVMYFAAKPYRGKQAELLKNSILHKCNQYGYWHSPLATAHAVTALLLLGQDPALLGDAIQYLLDTETNGRWPEAALYVELKNNHETIYSGCSAYASACCIEALQAYLNCSKSTVVLRNSTEDRLVANTITACKKLFAQSGEIAQAQLAEIFDAMLQKDLRSAIITMPYCFSQHMTCATSDVAQKLSVATALGWIGYTILDKALDGEHMIDQLPLSAKCIREAYLLFQSNTLDQSHHDTVKNILNGIERSVLWEHAVCKLVKNGDKITLPATLPDYGNYDCLARKSLGYALAPMIMCLNNGDAEQAKIVERFFSHYLIARQLNDDAHDWLDDLKQGFFNSVSVQMVKIWKIMSSKSTLDLAAEQNNLQKLFWEKYIDTICNDIINHCRRAREALVQLTVVTDTVFLEVLLLPLEQSAKQAVLERNKTMVFLSAIE